MDPVCVVLLAAAVLWLVRSRPWQTEPAFAASSRR